MAIAESLRLAGAALGTVGGVLLFLELFQVPSYVRYQEDLGSWDVDLTPTEVTEHTWLGRIGALSVSLGFALLFVGELI